MFKRLPLALVAALTACDAPADAEDEQVARDTLSALSGSSAQLSLFDRLLGPVNLSGVALALAPKKVIEQVRFGLDLALVDRACLKVDTDQQSYLDLRFTKCTYTPLYVHGHLRIDLATELGECAGEPCVIASRYTTTITDLTIGRSQVRSASSVLRIPELKLAPRSYVAEAELTDADDRELHLRHELTWLRERGCVTAELGAEFTVDDRTVSVGAEAVEVCGDECPRAGRVQVAWSTGRALAWEFTGAAEVVVHGPRGREFVIDAACGADP